MSSATMPLPRSIPPDGQARSRFHWVSRAFAGAGKRVMALVIIVLLLTLASSIAALLTARDMEHAMNAMVMEQLRGIQTAADLQSAVLRQRGMVTAYMLDEGGLPWLNDLDRTRPDLRRQFVLARQAAHGDEEQKALATLFDAYQAYDRRREDAIALFHDDHVREARRLLLGEVMILGDRTADLCQQVVDVNQRSMQAALLRAHDHVTRLTTALLASVILAMLTNLMLLSVVFKRLLLPVRRLAENARAVAPAGRGAAATPFHDELHELEFYSSALIYDVARTRTDLKDSQRRLLLSEKLAAVGRFAANAAHEIRNPLTSMNMWLYQLRQTAEHSPASSHACDVLESELGRLMQLTNSFLQLSRDPELRLAAVDAGEVLDVTLELARHRLAQKRLRLRREQPTVLPRIRADVEQLKQVLLNLIANAVEASPEGGELVVSQQAEGGSDSSALVIRVRDQGPGVSESIRDRLFDPFVTTKADGAGLGLALAASIVAAHGGRLELEASNPSGSTFAVHLPVETV